MNILVIAAHPDDEVLGCGGTIGRLTQEGHDVSIAILGEGITSRSAQRENANPEDLKSLQAQTRKVAQALGAREPFTFGLPDNRFDTLALLDIVKIIEKLIDQIEPQVIYTQHGGDLNVDHSAVYRATLTATRPMAGCPVKQLYAFEVPSATEWAFQQFAPAFHPNVFVDISATLELKINAMQIYDNEARAFPHPRSSEALRAIARRWGSVSGLPAAEAFHLVRSIQG
ncbi:MAG TPA: PIG-L deacetylase family protein [Pyrinomonadaceae bacterium]|jgi:LmbE family N-acetylglucosaminyl deacetylase|nr:PIG-L deacetylase family protein [Pyrinomonadaceae bacterium]